MKATIAKKEIEKIVRVEQNDPFSVLGNHIIQIKGKPAVVIRAFEPSAEEVSVVEDKANPQHWPMIRIHPDGLFEAVIPERKEAFAYLLDRRYIGGGTYIGHDPYCFLPVLSDYDLYLFNQGAHHSVYNRLGAHVIQMGDVEGVLFAVWAPNAKRVSVVGDFNQWDGRRHPMRNRGSSGVWELFLPELKPGAIYKFEIKSKGGALLLKADPYGFFNERRPKTASVVYDLDRYRWSDEEWLERRRNQDPLAQPVSIYEVHLGSWLRGDDVDNPFLNFRELAEKLVDHVEKLGFTHIELLPIAAHPLDGSWGYQVSGYYSVTPRFGTPEDFMYFVDYCHQHNIGVILDWVPAHFPKDTHALGWFDGTHLYEHEDPRQGEQKEWGTFVFNYGRNEVKNFLVANALFWFDKYHVDGLRTDAVASMLYLDYSRKEGEWIPNEFGGNENLAAVAFIRETNELVFKDYAGVIMAAEESTAWPAVSRPVYLGGLGFNLKWNMGWMHDTLLYMSKESIFRKYHQNLLTFSLLYAYHENFILPFSHDEVVHGKRSLLDKMPGDYWQKFANLRLLLGYMFGHPGKKLLFMGSEIGQWNEWNCERSVEWDLLNYDSHRGILHLVSALNRLLRSEPALHEIDFSHEGFDWIDINDTDNSVLSFLRRARDPQDQIDFCL